MTDPAPSPKAQGYNSVSRPRKKFKAFTPPDSLEGYYSAFWPVLIVFFAFIVLLIYEISFLRSRAMALQFQNSRMAEAVQKTGTQTTFIQGLHDDISKLAPTHPVAALLLKEFFPAAPIAPGESDDSSKAPSAVPDAAKVPGAETEAPPATVPPHP